MLFNNNYPKHKSLDIFKINQINNKGESALSIAVSNNNIEVVKILIEMGADINNANNNNESPYSIAIVNNYKECIELFNLVLANSNNYQN